MIGLLAAALAGLGTYLLWTALAFGWRGTGRELRIAARRRRGLKNWWQTSAREATAGMIVAAGAGGLVGFLLFGGALPAAISAGFAATFPLAALKARRRQRLALARDAWPRLLEQLRLMTGSLGYSIPQALFEVGKGAPLEMKPAFVAAEREWLLTTDFERTLALLRAQLADATADAVCETLFVANEVGGAGLDRRLAALISDRAHDVQARKDARSKQEGVRFARRFVLLVPLGMTLAGLSIGNGRHAYATTGGQLAVAAGLLGIVVCWLWSGRLLQLPEEPRVFAAGEFSEEIAADHSGRSGAEV